MRGLTREQISPGDRVYRYVWKGGEQSDLQFLTVLKVGRYFVDVQTDEGSRLLVPPSDLYSAKGLE